MKIVVLAGGTSTERDVSFVTGSKVYKALSKNPDNQVVLIDLYNGYTGEDFKDVFAVKRDWAAQIKDISEKNPDIDTVRRQRGGNPNNEIGPHVINICMQADIVFIALHGKNGEDGKVQAMFDLLDIKYTGTDCFSSAIAMDKAMSKELFIKNNIPHPEGITVTKGDEIVWDKFPCIVKVNNGGSSVGVYKVTDFLELEAAIKEAYTYDDILLIEEFIEGREFSIGVIDGKALPIIEIAPKVGFYDYKNKYQAGSAVETCPAELPEEVTLAMQAAAEDVFKALRLKSYARMDFRMDDEYNFYCLEANTLPGMTPTSLLPQEAAAMGMDFDTLCEELIRISFKKYEA